ncbi:hypothetical protein SAMN06297387_116129 [Streptomyces zhaozhouensis]|uniref:Abortive infection protein n=1 Tax=Streptomyces zhaozhouensis TaxID=1300267 RepID=A0A286E0L1_9ACTN|nr:hypothetical protein [Streptomyces zhaozhouensis]SOD64405.1 hypothetical protein SAMN06297387_116129 [Streptomyces zhaozhouensis]
MLNVRGVSYLVGDASEDAVRRDLRDIARELRCTTVMLIGPDTARLVAVGRLALDAGLDVYLRPHSAELPRALLLARLDELARRAEELRVRHPGRVTLMVGGEFSHTVPGIVPGPWSFVRLRVVLRFRRLLRRRVERRLNDLLAAAAATARRRFHGPLTYAAAGWESPDWSPFDLVGVNLYRSAGNRDDYVPRLRELVRSHEKPLVITEFGCGAFTGADARGAGSFQIVNWYATTPSIRRAHPRDESVQARYLGELIALYAAEAVHGCFVFTYAMPDFPHRDDPATDLDRAGFGLVAVTETGERRPKAAFHEVARRYGARDG